VYLLTGSMLQYLMHTCIDDNPNDDDDDDDDDECPSLEEAIDSCGGVNCVRRPDIVANETCIQCVMECEGELACITSFVAKYQIYREHHTVSIYQQHFDAGMYCLIIE